MYLKRSANITFFKKRTDIIILTIGRDHASLPVQRNKYRTQPPLSRRTGSYLRLHSLFWSGTGCSLFYFAWSVTFAVILAMSMRRRMMHVSRGAHQPALRERNDALIIGPGDELVEAHAAGDLEPAIPKPIVGRIPANSETIVHELPGSALAQSVVCCPRLHTKGTYPHTITDDRCYTNGSFSIHCISPSDNC
jgi:hypothetical protein